jgi:hypothetical protein
MNSALRALGWVEIVVGSACGIIGLVAALADFRSPPATLNEPERGSGVLLGLVLVAVGVSVGVPGLLLLRGRRWPQIALVAAGIAGIAKAF